MNLNPGAYAPVQRVKPFQVLMARLCEHYKTADRACKEVGISERSYYKLINDDAISVFVGRKILKHWNLVNGVAA